MSLDAAATTVRNWADKKDSNSYDDVLGHFGETYNHVEANQYKFSCGAMRTLVNNPLCAICPYNKDPYYSEDDIFWNVGIWKQSYYKTFYTKKETFRKTLTSFSLKPTAKGISRETFKNPDRPQNWSSFRAAVQKRGYKPEEVVILKEDLNSLKDLSESVQSQVNLSTGFSMNSLDVSAGIKELVMKQLESLPHFIDANITQGLYFFKNDWYWADASGTRNSVWEPSNNVFIREERIDKAFRIDISAVPPTESRHELADVVAQMQKINQPETIYPLLGYIAACFFSQRFKYLAKTSPVENIQNIPSLYFEGLAGSGKSQTVNFLIRKMCGLNSEVEELSGKTPFVLRHSLVPTTNTIPVFLDEVKEEIIANNKQKSSVDESTIKELIRQSWDNSVYMRGDYQKEDGVRKSETDAPVAFLGPSLPTCFDTAMRDRLVYVSIIQSLSRQHTGEWEKLRVMTEGNQKLAQIGLSILQMALKLDDKTILKGYIKSRDLILKYREFLVDRKFASLIKVVFGLQVLDRLWPNVFDLEKALLGTLKSFDIEDDNFEMSGPKINGDTDAIKHMRRKDDWDQWLEDVLNLCTVKSTNTSYQLTPKLDFWFVKGDDDLAPTVMVLDIKKALECYKRFKHSLKDHPIQLRDDQIITGAKTKGFLVSFEENELSAFGLKAPGSHARLPGPFIQLNTRELQRPNDRLQYAFRLDGIPGFEDPKVMREQVNSPRASQQLPWNS